MPAQPVVIDQPARRDRESKRRVVGWFMVQASVRRGG